MKSLHLLRHAKSSWKDPSLNDHDRPLNKRGRQTAEMMAAYLRRAKIAPDLVMCSTAMRAQQTLDPILKAAKKPPTIILVRGIHEGTQRALWEQLWNLPESANSEEEAGAYARNGTPSHPSAELCAPLCARPSALGRSA